MTRRGMIVVGLITALLAGALLFAIYRLTPAHAEPCSWSAPC